jgi:hypothetical protein
MCGGGGGGGVSEQLAVQSAQQEQARQDRINQGMRDLETMFSGGKRTTGQVGAGAKYDPNATYYTKDGSKWAPGDVSQFRTNNRVMTSGGGWSGAASPENQTYTEPTYSEDTFSTDDSARQTMFDQALGGGLYSGVEDVQGYGPSFYDKAYNAQLDYAMPQVDRQYADAQKNLEFALARQGLSASSQAGQLQADLARQRDLAVQGEQDKANTVRQQQMSAVEDERSQLTQMLQQTGDVQSTMNAAASRKNIIDAAPAIQEVAPLFQNATGALADMIVPPSVRAAGSSRTGSGGYGSTKGSGKVVT